MFGWVSFIPMASLTFYIGDSKSSIDEIKPGDMFLINKNDNHEKYSIDEYDHIEV
jgi:hypothetical protein